MRKKIIYSDTEVIRIEDDNGVYDAMSTDEYMLVQTMPLAKKMLETRGIDQSSFSIFDLYAF
jgi:hypothetical protein